MSLWHVVGRVRDAHGIKGELFVALKAGQADWLESLEVLGIGQDGQFVERTVVAARPHKNGLIVRLEGMVDRNQAEAVRGQIVAIPEEYLVADDGEALFLKQIEGIVVTDERLGVLGPVVAFSSNNFQDLLVVETRKGRFEIPFVEELILEFDLEARKLLMDLPEGLVEV